MKVSKVSTDRIYRAAVRAVLSMVLFHCSIILAVSQEQGDAGDVERIQNPAIPPLQETWRCEELWRVGGEDDDDLLLGLVADLLIDEQGYVYILDSQLCQVNVISPDGEWLRTLSRNGDGPGEITLPSSLLLIGDDEIGIVQGYPSKVVKMTTADVPTGTIIVGDCDSGAQGVRISMNAAYREERLMILGAKMTFAEGEKINTLYLASFDELGCELHRFAEMEEKNEITKTIWRITEKQNFFPATRWALGRGGHVFIAPDRDRYEINELGPDGELLRVISREFAAKKRTKEDFARIKSGYSSNIPGLKYKFDLEFFEPAILSIAWSPEGMLWVSNCLSASDLPEGICWRYDLFDNGGRLVKEVLVAMPFNFDEDDFYRLDQNHFVRVTGMKAAAATAGRAKGFNTGNESNLELEGVPVEVILYKVVDRI